jgi:sugar lactone lactonase YvrE
MGRMSLRSVIERLRPGAIATIAGTGWREGADAASTGVGWPMGVVRRDDGDLIVVEYFGNRIWRIDGRGVLHTFAGDGVAGFSGDGGPARDARFNGPHDLWRDAAGNLWLSDLGNYRIRRIDARTGVITTVAGCGRRGRAGDGGPALEAELDTASGVATDAEGNLYIADEYGNTVRRVDPRGIITRYAGTGVGGYNGDGIPAADAALFHPEHLAFDSAGNLYVCDNSNDRIRMIDRRGIIHTVFGNPVMAQVDGQMTRSSAGDGGPAREALVLMPDSLFVDRRDNIYVGEKYGFRVRRVDGATGMVQTVVGTGLPGFGEDGDVGERSSINSCESGLWVDDDGSVFWDDCSGRLRRVDGRTRVVTTVLGGRTIGDGLRATEAFLRAPCGLDVARDGTIYFADTWNHRIRAIDPETGSIRTVAGNGAREYGGDGGPALEAFLANPYDVAVDDRGNVFVADSRRAHVRRVDAAGVITTYAGTGFPWDTGDGGPAIAARVTQPISVTIGPGGDLYQGDGVGRIRRVDRSTGRNHAVAGSGIRGYRGDGGPATEARITQPVALAFGPDGALYFTDTGNHVVRRVDRSGIISTVAGTGERGVSPDGTLARDARLAGPRGVAVDEKGRVFIADTENHRVVAVTGQGRLAVVAGTGEGGEGADGEARACRLNRPHNLALFGRDCLLISDHNNNRIRAVKLEAPA